MRNLILFMTVALLSFSSSALYAKDKSTIYQFMNDKGSKMEFVIDPTSNQLKGTYTSALGCAIDVPYPLTGWSNKKAISFTVNFGKCGSITSWVGHWEKEGSLKTIWTLSRGDSTDWNTLLTGASTFTPTHKTQGK